MSDSLRDVIYDAMGRPGDWEKGVIQPSQFELDNHSLWRAIAGDVARAITEAGWRPPLPNAPRLSREDLGRRIREVWVRWAREQAEPKPSWLLSWEDLDDGQREVDMRMGEALFALGMTWSPAPPAPSAEVDAEAAPDGWYPAAMREHDRANAAELDRNAARQRAASWWEAAKTLNRWGTAHREQHRKALVEIANLTAIRDELAHQRDDHRARADAAGAKLDQIREVLAEDMSTRARFQVDVSTSYGPRFLNRIRAILGEAQP